MKKLKRSVIKEELVKLTGDFKKAVILNQMIFWSERVNDFDKFIEAERNRMESHGEDLTMRPQNGWIYKSAEELSEETMLGLSPKNMRTHIKELVKNGWLDERTNPHYKWDRTKQYRVNIVKIQQDLYKLGYALENYPLYNNAIENSKRTIEGAKTKNAYVETKNQVVETKNQRTQMENAIPKTTTETTLIDNNIDDVVVQKYQSKINDVTGGHISLAQVVSLLKTVGPKKVDKYIELFPLFVESQNIYNTVGFFIKACLNEYQPPKSSQKEYEFNKFEQHEYDEDDLESLFLDIENM